MQNVCVIDICSDLNVIFQQINNCKCILSSSLHGLIFADSYGIPNIHILFSDTIGGGEYKFKDYYSVFSVPYQQPIDLRVQTITDDDISNIINNYKIDPDEVRTIQRNLLKCFPYANIIDN